MKSNNAKPKMILRWFYGGDDSVTLEQIRQIPGVTGVCTALTDVPVGEVWPLERLQAMKAEINAAGLEVEVIESVNIHVNMQGRRWSQKRIYHKATRRNIQ